MAIYYATPAGAGAKTGASWATAFGEAELETSLTNSATAGDVYYIAEGTYTLDSSYACSARDGTTSAPISLIGVKTGTTNESPIYSDWSLGVINGETDNRPLFALGTYTFTGGDCWRLVNLIFTGTATSMVTTAIDSILFNCKIVQQSATANRTGWNATGIVQIAILCEFCGLVGTGVVGYGIVDNSTFYTVMCYFHDLNRGISSSGATAGAVLFHDVFDHCTNYGAYATTVRWNALNCSFHDCGASLYAQLPPHLVVNCIFEGSTASGISLNSQQDNAFYFGNHGDDTRNTDMWLNVSTTLPHSDPLVSTGDPLFFADRKVTLQPGSPCINSGISTILGL